MHHLHFFPEISIEIPPCVFKPRTFNRGEGKNKIHKIYRSFCMEDIMKPAITAEKYSV
jgi:hypothetical protein